MPGSDCDEFLLADEDQASRFGAALGRCLRRGDTVLLQGPVGAGKSHIARAAIRAIVGAGTEVPSPSFTLVQVYDGPESDDRPACEIWHADLYRLTSPDEVLELGLADAMAEAIVLIEWPDRLGSLVPEGAIRIVLVPIGDARCARVSGASDAVVRQLRGALE